MNMGPPEALEEHIARHYEEVKPLAIEGGDHYSWIARDDQTIQHLRNLGWDDIAIGAFLAIESLNDADRVADYCPATALLGALYFRGGAVRGVGE